MVDEACANFNAIQAVFGKEMLAHTVTCQWHFKSCAKCQLPSILPEDQNSFIEMIGKLYKTYVRSEYIRVVAVLVEICKVNEIISWSEWWEAWKFHIVPAFRGFCVSGLNLAEVGHAMLKTSHKMWLSMATQRHMPLHGPGQKTYWLPDKFHTPVRKRAHTFADKKEKKES